MSLRTIKLTNEQLISVYNFMFAKKKADRRDWMYTKSQYTRFLETYEYLCELYGSSIKSLSGMYAIENQLSVCDAYVRSNDKMPNLQPEPLVREVVVENNIHHHHFHSNTPRYIAPPAMTPVIPVAPYYNDRTSTVSTRLAVGAIALGFAALFNGD